MINDMDSAQTKLFHFDQAALNHQISQMYQTYPAQVTLQKCESS